MSTSKREASGSDKEGALRRIKEKMMDVDLTSTEQKSEIKSAVLCWLATAASDGTPNVSPKELWDVHDERTLVIAEIASAGSVRNLSEVASVDSDLVQTPINLCQVIDHTGAPSC